MQQHRRRDVGGLSWPIHEDLSSCSKKGNQPGLQVSETPDRFDSFRTVSWVLDYRGDGPREREEKAQKAERERKKNEQGGEGDVARRQQVEEGAAEEALSGVESGAGASLRSPESHADGDPNSEASEVWDALGPFMKELLFHARTQEEFEAAKEKLSPKVAEELLKKHGILGSTETLLSTQKSAEDIMKELWSMAHPSGAYCDACLNSSDHLMVCKIVGTRYKSRRLEAYDLCHSCWNSLTQVDQLSYERISIQNEPDQVVMNQLLSQGCPENESRQACIAMAIGLFPGYPEMDPDREWAPSKPTTDNDIETSFQWYDASNDTESTFHRWNIHMYWTMCVFASHGHLDFIE